MNSVVNGKFSESTRGPDVLVYASTWVAYEKAHRESFGLSINFAMGIGIDPLNLS